jgi:hypothetical protein
MACNYAPIYFITARAAGESIQHITAYARLTLCGNLLFSPMNMDVCLRADKTMRANSAAADFARRICIYLFVYVCRAPRRFVSSFARSQVWWDKFDQSSYSHWVGKRRRCKRENQLCHCWRHVTDSLIRARRAALLLRRRPSPRVLRW